MKTYVVLGCAIAALTGCAEYRGGVDDESGRQTGSVTGQGSAQTNGSTTGSTSDRSSGASSVDNQSPASTSNPPK